MKRILILTLSVIMLISALCIPSFADANELPYVSADRYMLPEITPYGEISNGFDTPYYYFQVSSTCYHEWDGNTCILCGTTCEHSMGMDYYSDDRAFYEYNYCMNGCGYSTEPYSTVPHTYVDGVCTVCSHECTHSSTDENGDCIFCTPKECEEHTFVGETCSVCGYTCTHPSVEGEGTCDDCGSYVGYTPPHEHTWENGTCTSCNAVCEHPTTSERNNSTDYARDWCIVCDTCGEITMDDYCSHQYQDGTCPSCGYECTHSSLNGGSGVCSACELTIDENGEVVCPHDNVTLDDVYTDEGYMTGYEFCNDCNTLISDYTVIPHNYINGVCSSCGHECTHSKTDDNGDCVYCTPKAECTEHTFVIGACSKCGFVCSHLSSRVVDTSNDERHDIVYYCELCNSITADLCGVHIYEDGRCCECGHECTHSATDDNGDCAYCTAKADTPDAPDTPDTSEPSTPSTSAPSASDDEEGFSIKGFFGILAGGAVIFGIIYAVSALKEKRR